jgi:hypothetical protein
MENAIVIRPMIYKEARECADNISSNMNNVRQLILELYDRKGWDALGYKSWRECVTAEFKQGENYLYKQLEAAQTERNLCTKVQIPETHLRPLTKLRDNPEQQRTAWQKAVETAPDGKVTAAHVSKVVKEIIGEPHQSQKEDIDVISESRNLSNIKTAWNTCSTSDKMAFIKWGKEYFNCYFK